MDGKKDTKQSDETSKKYGRRVTTADLSRFTSALHELTGNALAPYAVVEFLIAAWFATCEEL